MLGGRPLQNLSAELHADANAWTIGRLDFRAPGSTQVSLNGSPNGTNVQAATPGTVKGALDVNSSDPDTLMAWLQGRSEINFRSQKPLHLHGDVSVAADRVAIDAMKAEIDGGAVSGRVAFAAPSASGGSRFDAELKADRLDLDAATAFVRSMAGPQAEWPEKAQLSFDIGRAISAGQELGPLLAKLGYDPKTIMLEQLKVGRPDNVSFEGGGNFDRAGAKGKLTLDSTAASLGKITGLIAPFAPSFAARLNALGPDSGPAHLKLALNLGNTKAQSDVASRSSRSRCAAAQGPGHRDRDAACQRDPRSGPRQDPAQRICARTPICHRRGPTHCWRCWGSIGRSRQATARRNSRDRRPESGTGRCA